MTACERPGLAAMGGGSKILQRFKPAHPVAFTGQYDQYSFDERSNKDGVLGTHTGTPGTQQ
jgi:hypothetical protein